MKNLILGIMFVFSIMFCGCLDTDKKWSVRFFNDSSYAVTSCNIGGENAGSIAPGSMSGSYEFGIGGLTVSWTYSLGSTSYSFELPEGDWQVVWDGTHTTLESISE
ncbi:MAG TPA: hypothetical protein PKK43_11710 [Spirochaetota bacterium]|nr:hypothetical protein [Spirochaetota bacterium]